MLAWVRPIGSEMQLTSEERRIRAFLSTGAGVSESVESLANKLGVRRQPCRKTLEQLVSEGVVDRQDYRGMQPQYVRFPRRA